MRKSFQKIKIMLPAKQKWALFLLKKSYFNDKQGYNFFCLDLPLLGFGTFKHLYLSDKNKKKLAQANPGERRKIAFFDSIFFKNSLNFLRF